MSDPLYYPKKGEKLVIKANFNTYASYVTDSLYQWDLNQVLSVSGLNLSVVPEVHFSNANMDRAIVRQATKVNNVVSVRIPNSLLQDPLTIKAHIGIYEGDTFKVVEKIDIPVIPRKRPNDYQIQDSDEEIYSFQALENAIANMTTKAEASVISARIDTIVANANKTDGNSELIDMRVDTRGKTHDSAGKAVRNQFTELENKVNYGVMNCEFVADLLPRDSFVDNAFLTNNGGVNTETNGVCYTEDYIAIRSGYKYRGFFKSTTGDNLMYWGCCYDSKKNWIGSIPREVDYFGFLTLPENTAYVRCNAMMEYVDSECYFEEYKILDARSLKWLKVTADNLDETAINLVSELIADNTTEVKTYVNKPFTFKNANAIFFGDSIVQGFTDMGSTVTKHTFPKLFSDKVGMTYVNKGVAGSGFGILNNSIPETIRNNFNLLSNYSYLFLAGGVNDWQNGVDLTTFEKSVKELFSWIKASYAGEVIVIAPIDCNFTNNEIAKLDEYRTILGKYAILNEFSFINGKDFNFPKTSDDVTISLFGDGQLHPSEFGYRHYTKCLCSLLC